MSDEFPNGWSYIFKENGNTIDDIEINGGETKPLDLLITIGSQATYNINGDMFEALAAKIGDDTVNAAQPITVFLKKTGGFDLSSLKFKTNLEPGESFTFQLNLENTANADDSFTLSASYPSGWRVVFPNDNTISILAGRSEVIPIQVTVGDDARNGDEASITISITSQLSNIEQKQIFVVEVEQGFTDRLVSAFSDLWYVFAFLGLIMTIGFATYSRSDEDEWDDYEDEDDTDISSSNTSSQSDDDWDDWN